MPWFPKIFQKCSRMGACENKTFAFAPDSEIFHPGSYWNLQITVWMCRQISHSIYSCYNSYLHDLWVCELVSLSFCLICVLLSAHSLLLLCTETDICCTHINTIWSLICYSQGVSCDFHGVISVSHGASFGALHSLSHASPSSCFQLRGRISSRKPPSARRLCEQHMPKKAGPNCPNFLFRVFDVHVWWQFTSLCKYNQKHSGLGAIYNHILPPQLSKVSIVNVWK